MKPKDAIKLKDVTMIRREKFPSLLCFLDHALVSSQLADVEFYRHATYSRNTCKAYRTHRKTYLQFCNILGALPVPASTLHLCVYAAYLARFLLPSSVCGYLNFVGLLHKESGLANPLLDN